MGKALLILNNLSITKMCLQFALAASLSHQAQESHAAELAQYLEGKKSLDDFKKSVERQRCGPYSDLGVRVFFQMQYEFEQCSKHWRVPH